MDEPVPPVPPNNVIHLKSRTLRVLGGDRFVYDVVALGADYAVTFKGTAITRHPTREAALENAQLIAKNFWATGRRTMVRVIEADGTISPIAAFG